MGIQVKKTNDHLVLNYTHYTGTKFTQEFDLPERVTFATNLGKHSVVNYQIRTGPSLPDFLSFLNPLFTRTRTVTYRQEEFLLLSYSEIEANAVCSPLSPGGRGDGGEGERR